MLSKIIETCQKDMETNVKGLLHTKVFNLSMENNIITIDDNTINPKINIWYNAFIKYFKMRQMVANKAILSHVI